MTALTPQDRELELAQQVAETYEAGFSMSEVAERLGISFKTVRGVMTRHGIERRSGGRGGLKAPSGWRGDQASYEEFRKSRPNSDADSRPAAGFEGLYTVYATGHIWSDRAKKFIRPSVWPSGYLRVGLTAASGKSRSMFVHQAVLEAFVGLCPDGLLTRHLNGNPHDNRLENLAYGTPAENARDTVEHGMNPHSNKTHCPRGHELAAPNLMPAALKVRNRACLACNRAHGRVRNARIRRGIALDFLVEAERAYAEIMNLKES